MPQIDVCIATYKRPLLLCKLLSSLFAQVTEGKLTLNIIVVDNDAQRSAETVVREFMIDARRIIYDVEPQQNIALARNKALSHASGDLIATIDDDEYADAHWLLSLYQAMISHQADVVMGPVIRIFPQKTPEYVIQSPSYNFPNPSTGATQNFVHSTRSCLMRRALIENMEIPFNPEFGLTGGEDSVFFEHLKREKHKIVWCREAQAYETITADKTTLFWLLKHFFRNGYVTRLMMKKELVNSDHPPMSAMTYNCLRRLSINCAGATKQFLWSLVEPRRQIKAVHHAQDLAFDLGFLLSSLNIHYEAYK